MKLYLDIIIITNFLFDFILLLTVSIVLKRKCNIFRLILGSLFGSVTLLSLFIKLNNIELFLLKIIMGMIMILISFEYKNLKKYLKELFYLYFVSIFAGGLIYLINDNFGYKHEGLLFINNGISLNIIILFILFILSIYIYIKQSKDLKRKVSSYHFVDIYYNNKIYTCNGYIDTANKLYDQYKRRPVSLIYKDIKINNPIYVSYKTINKIGIIKCFIADKIIIDHKITYKNQLIGISKEDFNIDGVDFILHSDLEGYND